MSMREYWERLVCSNRGLSDENAKITLSVRSFRQQIEKAYTEGVESVEDAPSDFSFDLFRKMFGGK